mgnify:CR=1 FL=1
MRRPTSSRRRLKRRAGFWPKLVQLSSLEPSWPSARQLTFAQLHSTRLTCAFNWRSLENATRPLEWNWRWQLFSPQTAFNLHSPAWPQSICSPPPPPPSPLVPINRRQNSSWPPLHLSGERWAWQPPLPSRVEPLIDILQQSAAKSCQWRHYRPAILVIRSFEFAHTSKGGRAATHPPDNGAGGPFGLDGASGWRNKQTERLPCRST